MEIKKSKKVMVSESKCFWIRVAVLPVIFFGLTMVLNGCRTEKVIDTATGTKPLKEVNGYRGKLFLGIGTEVVNLPNDIVKYLISSEKKYGKAENGVLPEKNRNAGKKKFYGLKINRICVGSTADKAGFRNGDIIIRMDGQTWDSKPVKLYKAFGKTRDDLGPGDIMEAEILRPTGNGEEKELITLKFRLLPYPFTSAESPCAPTNEQIRPDLAGYHPDYEELCLDLVKSAGMKKDYDDQLARLKKCEEYPDPCRLDIERYVHRDPFKLEKVTRELIKAFNLRKGQGTVRVSDVIQRAEQVMYDFTKTGKRAGGSNKIFDREQSKQKGRGVATADYKGRDLKAHLDFIEGVLGKAASFHRQALKKLSDDDIRLILANRDNLLDAYLNYRMLSYDNNYRNQKKYLKIIKLAKKLDYRAIFEQAMVLSELCSEEFCSSLKEALRKSGKNLDGAVIAGRATAYGRILIAGRKHNRHQGDYAVIYDLGGDDIYAGNNASSSWNGVKAQIPSAVIVDFAGNDAYENNDTFSLACGDIGVGILVDKNGNDSYIGKRFSQGAGFMGVGILLDEKGDDIYRTFELSQGIGHFGAGILIDAAGNNRFESHDTSQGVGLPGGFGLLCCGSGSDSYYCKGARPSGYGTRGVFEGWGQGMGIGYRPYASGGLGILVDSDGKNYFEAGNFCQGGGYYYGYGVLYNGGKAGDRYVGSRYAQGFGCHQAAGALIDEGGDDFYTTRYCVAQGLSWDEASGLFIDESGNDHYEGGGFSQGASAMNGFIIFIDRGGKDHYLYTDQARAGGNSYHGGTSLSLFIDEGGEKDIYHRNKGNSIIITGREHSLFVDLPASVSDALKDDYWKKLLKNNDKKKRKKIQ